MTEDIDRGPDPDPSRDTRKSTRVTLRAEVKMRRAGFPNYLVALDDLSPGGCRVEFVDRPNLSERVWIKLEGLESLEGTIRWVRGIEAGIEFDRPLHAAVFELLMNRLR